MKILKGEGIHCMRMLKQHKHYFDKNTFRTLKGQILSGDLNGFKKGFYRRTLKGGE